jgi:hypothetical protein
MKKLLCFSIPTILLIHSAIAEADSTRVKTRNTIGLEFYRPLETADDANNSLNDLFNFYSANYPNKQVVDAERKKTSFSFGLSYEREFKNQIILRARGGYSIINQTETESASFDTVLFNLGIPFLPTVTSSNKWENGFTHNQNKINLFIGFGKRLYMSRKFSFDAGIETGLIRALEGITEYRTFESTSLSSIPTSSTENITTITDAPVNTFGMGPFFKPTYYPIPRLAISLEAQMFFLGTFSERSTTVEDKSEIFSAGNIFGGGSGTTNNTSTSYTLKQTGAQWNWSLISPLLRIGFRF